MTQGDVARFDKLVAIEKARQLGQELPAVESGFLAWRGMPAMDLWYDKGDGDVGAVRDAAVAALVRFVLFGE